MGSMRGRLVPTLAALWAFALAGMAAAAGLPAAEPAAVVAMDLAGPEGIAFTKHDGFIVGTVTGDVVRIDANGSQSVIANVGDALAGITVLRDGTIAAAALQAGRVWAVTPQGVTSILASGLGGPNFVVQTRRGGRILVSASVAGEIVDITDGTPVVIASGLSFPNGLAVAKRRGQRHLYVAETGTGQLSRFPLSDTDALGAIEPVATGLPLADGVAIDRGGNVLVVGGGVLNAVARKTGQVEPLLPADPTFDFPTNLAFGRGRGFKRRDVYMPNFGAMFGNGTTVVKFRYNRSGTRLIR